jgi:hypothetical protein
MKRVFTFLFLFVCLSFFLSDVQAQITSSTGVIGYTMSNYGRIRVGSPLENTAGRQLDRMSIIAALKKDTVFDYTDDADTTAYKVRKITVAKVDSAIECITNYNFVTPVPPIRVRQTILAWNNQSYIIVRFRVINDGSIAYPLYLGAVIVPKIGGLYGGETVQYEPTKKVGYNFRSGENNYIGVKLLGKDPYSVKSRDWDSYSTDPSSDVAADSVRYNMTAGTGFDAALVSGSDGSIYNVNAGLYTVAAHDSAQIFYAVAYGTSLATMLGVIDSAAAKYNSVLTSVREIPSNVPSSFLLKQNFPNPFNPSTQIEFSITERSFVTLTVHDLLGRTIQTLTQGTLGVGTYSTTFDGSRLTSGIYYYTITAGSRQETKKMLLIK